MGARRSSLLFTSALRTLLRCALTEALHPVSRSQKALIRSVLLEHVGRGKLVLAPCAVSWPRGRGLTTRARWRMPSDRIFPIWPNFGANVPIPVCSFTTSSVGGGRGERAHGVQCEAISVENVNGHGNIYKEPPRQRMDH